jgi:hypothetical protein
MALLIPLVVGAGTIAATIIIHALALNTTVRFVHRERILGHAGKGFWIDVPIVMLVISLGPSCSPDSNGHMGGFVHGVRGISGFRHRLLPLGR